MAPSSPTHFLVIGAGAAGLMAARELARAGKKVTLLEARDRLGGRIYPLPAAAFGYAAEGGAEFIHGASAVTLGLMREARLSTAPGGGRRWTARDGTLTPDESPLFHAGKLHQALATLETDLPIAEFLATRFAEPRYAELRQAITRMVEGYDAADPQRASTFALRDEWMDRGQAQHGRVAEGYGALIDFLAAECRRHGAAIHLGAAVTAIETIAGGIAARSRDGARVEADAAILTVPLPLLREIALPPEAAAQAAVGADIGYGNVVKILLRFASKWWAVQDGKNLDDLSFIISRAKVPTWWTQHPAEHPVLTGWYAGPKADRVADLTEDALTQMALDSLGEIFGVARDELARQLVASRSLNWGNDPFARGAYSYATVKTREAQQAMSRWEGGPLLFSGEALYAGPEMGTVEAALASGRDTAKMILAEA